MDKTAINFKESHIIDEKERVIIISVPYTVNDETAKEVMRRVKALSSDEIVKQTKWIEVSELDKRTEHPDLVFIYDHGILFIENVWLLVTMAKIGFVKCINKEEM